MDIYKAASKLENRCRRSICEACPARIELGCAMDTPPYAYFTMQSHLGTSQYSKKKTRKKMLKAIASMRQACLDVLCTECYFWDEVRTKCNIGSPYHGCARALEGKRK